MILRELLKSNDTLGSLGDLEKNIYMGVKIREDLRQAISLNNSSHAQKKAFLEQLAANNRKKNLDGKLVDAGKA